MRATVRSSGYLLAQEVGALLNLYLTGQGAAW